MIENKDTLAETKFKFNESLKIQKPYNPCDISVKDFNLKLNIISQMNLEETKVYVY